MQQNFDRHKDGDVVTFDLALKNEQPHLLKAGYV
jgi:hypothetical protein